MRWVVDDYAIWKWRFLGFGNMIIECPDLLRVDSCGQLRVRSHVAGRSQVSERRCPGERKFN